MERADRRRFSGDSIEKREEWTISIGIEDQSGQLVHLFLLLLIRFQKLDAPEVDEWDNNEQVFGGGGVSHASRHSLVRLR